MYSVLNMLQMTQHLSSVRCHCRRFDGKRRGQYTGDAGWAFTVGIPVKIGIAHGKSVTEVGSAKRIGDCGRKGVPPAPLIFGTSKQKISPLPTF